MEFKEAMRTWGRMCHSIGTCGSCTLSATSPNECATWVMTNTKVAEEIFKKWAAEHPERTIADNFFEKHPNADKDLNGVPYVCAMQCGYVKECRTDGRCEKCWWQPLEEQDNGKS